MGRERGLGCCENVRACCLGLSQKRCPMMQINKGRSGYVEAQMVGTRKTFNKIAHCGSIKGGVPMFCFPRG